SRPRRIEHAKSRSIRSAAERLSSGRPRKRLSQSLDRSSWRRNASAERSSSRSSYAVRPRLLARTGDSANSSVTNVSTKSVNDDIGASPDNAYAVSLTEYQRKRDFKRTPEPKGTVQPAPPRSRYVVHRHHATRLHWAVRLELRGGLVAFAV